MSDDDTLAIMAMLAAIKRNMLDLLQSELSVMRESKIDEVNTIRLDVEKMLLEMFENMQVTYTLSMENNVKEAEEYLKAEDI
jgi:hypothetical protein